MIDSRVWGILLHKLAKKVGELFESEEERRSRKRWEAISTLLNLLAMLFILGGAAYLIIGQQSGLSLVGAQ